MTKIGNVLNARRQSVPNHPLWHWYLLWHQKTTLIKGNRHTPEAFSTTKLNDYNIRKWLGDSDSRPIDKVRERSPYLGSRTQLGQGSHKPWTTHTTFGGFTNDDCTRSRTQVQPHCSYIERWLPFLPFSLSLIPNQKYYVHLLYI